MKRNLIYVIVPVIVVTIVLFAAGLVPVPGQGEDGAQLYERMCALCHGSLGEGYGAAGAVALGNPKFLAVADDAYLFENIARGRQGTRMSVWSDTYGGPLTDDQVRQIVRYIRQWQTEPVVDISSIEVTGDPGQGMVIYVRECASCHGDQGEGRDEAPAAPNGAPSLNHPTFLETASDGFIQFSVAKGRPGMSMPAYEGVLSAEEIGDVVAYIRAWQK